MSVKEPLIILDFETTGLSADFSRIIEVGAVRVEENRIVDSFSELMNPGFPIPSFITQFTGITNSMVRDKPSPEEIMPELFEFIGERPVMAHNAPFDRKFLLSEMARANFNLKNSFLCTLKLSRRLIESESGYSLGVLADSLGLETEDIEHRHRALDDVKVTFRLWRYLQQAVVRLSGVSDHTLEIYHEISKLPKKKVKVCLEDYCLEKEQ